MLLLQGRHLFHRFGSAIHENIAAPAKHRTIGELADSSFHLLTSVKVKFRVHTSQRFEGEEASLATEFARIAVRVAFHK
jgi:hypothetical protein